jgi:glycosyltransferase involved in cell wall biosynthesis
MASIAFNHNKKTLIIIGDGKQKEELQKKAKSHIHFLGRQPDSVVNEYMQNCRALIFPGEDDFGITPIEAMATGKPVIAYKKGGVTETIIENKTGVFFTNQTYEDLIGALSRFINLDRDKQFDPIFIANHAQKFDEEIFKNELFKYIKDIIPKKTLKIQA